MMEKPNKRPEDDGVVHLAQERKRRDDEQKLREKELKRLEKAHRATMDGKGLNKNVLIGSLVPIILILLILFQDYLMALFR